MDAITPVAGLHCCPTCGAAIHDQFSWDYGNRTFIAGGKAVRFSRSHTEIFHAIWSAKTPIFSLERLGQLAYADRIDGGPDYLSTISVQLSRMREQLKGCGYTICQNIGSPRTGYRIVKEVA